MNINIVYCSNEMNSYTNILGEFISDSIIEPPSGLDSKGILIEDNNLFNISEIILFGCNVKEMISKPTSNRILVTIKCDNKEEYVVNYIHFLIGDYILEYEMIDSIWNDYYNMKTVEYNLYMIYDINTSDKAKSIKDMNLEEIELIREDLENILEECTPVE